ncbi:putative transcriptional regulatory protein C139.03-like protein 8 [Colletotrichum chlorophyti]|uniref:Putative transcriptional regulatory protein C139.03-like protein 8 n=1 Tax=Colletotrichum chlorophyti TaxID=708187 RepID=A0A1Q8RPJ4_9PEZI|nr:putative transcriptional regulatory protein C139.03-like protein 8 [Colletotrichum chlorophyti]
MSASQSALHQTHHKHACSLCARRKVKCDRNEPCSSCVKSQAGCSYEAPVASKPRKRAADEDLLARISQYEELMRKHNVDFTPLSFTWVPSRPGSTAKENEGENSSLASPPPYSLQPNSQPVNTTATGRNRRRRQLNGHFFKVSLAEPEPRDDPYVFDELPLHQLAYNNQPSLRELHPQPRHIYSLWQIFVDKVNPLLKIVHVPSLGRRVLDASWDPGAASKSLTAVLFVMYNLAVVAISAEECQASLGQPKEVLLARFRMASFRALVEADFLTTRDFEVLQAFVLFLFVEPDSDLTSTLTGAAIRIGHKIGLDRDKPDDKLSVLEKELRIRLWWQLNGVDSRVRSVKGQAMKNAPSRSEFGNIRSPLNVNDADLHPDMAEIPREHIGTTEMSAVLLKFEIYGWLRSSANASKLMEIIMQGSSSGVPPKLTAEALQELESNYNEKFLRHLDHSIPLHRLTYAVARLSTARMQFKLHHPRGQSAANDGEVHMSQHDSDVLFKASVTWLEMVDMAMQSGFSRRLIAHFTSKSTVDVYIYMISELRQRTSGQLVNVAWNLVEALYSNHPQLIEETDNKFFAALGELTLDAWESRKEALVQSHGDQTTPQPLQMLWRARRGDKVQSEELGITDEASLNDVGFPDDITIDWGYWSDFLR